MVDLAPEFARLGHSVEFALMQATGDFLSEAQGDFSVVDLAAPRVRSVPLALARYLRKHKPDAMIANMWPLTVIAPLAQRLSGHDCRVLVCEHGTLSVGYAGWGRTHQLSMRASMALGYRLAASRVGVSSGVADDMARLSGLPRHLFAAVHNPVPVRQRPDHAATAMAETVWRSTSGLRIITVGSMKAVKNHPLLLRAFAKLDLADARLMFVGAGHGYDSLVALAADLGLADRVIFAGFHIDPSPFYATADLFVLSSDSEGLPTALIEALGHGLPVVSTDCPSGPGEILENGRYGRLVPVGDAAALTAAMAEALAADHDREALKRRAADFAPEIAAKKYLDLLFPQ